MSLKTKEIVIPAEMMEQEWQTNKIKIRKWNLSIRGQIIDEVTKVTATSRHDFKADLATGFTQILVITKCILEAPWKVGDITTIGELEPALGDWLYSEINKFNEGETKN